MSKMAPNRFNFHSKTLEERKQEEIRAFRVKAEYLKLTLRDLQDMLNAEKEKLMHEKGEVEGLAKEKGLVLLEPSQEIPVTHSPAAENYGETQQLPQSHSVSHTQQSDCQPQVQINLGNHLMAADGMEWGQGDAGTWSGNCIFNPAGDWTGQQFGDYSTAIWDEPFPHELLDLPHTAENPFSEELMFTNGYLEEIPYNNQSIESPSYNDYTFGMRASDFDADYQLEKPDQPSSQQHLAALLKEVDHITQAIDELDNQ